mgnify:CR=1 FL=1
MLELVPPDCHHSSVIQDYVVPSGVFLWVIHSPLEDGALHDAREPGILAGYNDDLVTPL